MSDEDIVGRIMDKAAMADRRALFAALQMALSEMIDLQFGGRRGSNPYVRVEEALDLGAEVGSPEHLAHIQADNARLIAQREALAAAVVSLRAGAPQRQGETSYGC
jgi:hypothetical protein